MATPEVARLPAGRTIAEAIASALRSDITSGRLRAGERLRQVPLANRFNVSTTPVREAFAILQHEGLVRMHPQRGATVFVPSTEDLHEHYEIRAALEALAVELAAANFEPADAPPLSRSSTRCPRARTQRYIQLNHRFHMSALPVLEAEPARRAHLQAPQRLRGVPPDLRRRGGPVAAARPRAPRDPRRVRRARSRAEPRAPSASTSRRPSSTSRGTWPTLARSAGRTARSKRRGRSGVPCTSSGEGEDRTSRVRRL